MQREQLRLERLDRELVQWGQRCGIARQELLARYLGHEHDPDWLAELALLSQPSWQQLVREHGPQMAELQEALLAIAQRTGLPLPDLRHVLREVNRARQAIRNAEEEMVRRHLHLVAGIAKRVRRHGSLQLLDLIQEGNLGLMHAIQKFDYRRGVRFSTYAAWWIRQTIARAIIDQDRTIRIPVHMAETATGAAGAVQASSTPGTRARHR